MCFRSHGIELFEGGNVHISFMKQWKVFIFLHNSNNCHKVQCVELQMNSETDFLFSVFSSRLSTVHSIPCWKEDRNESQKEEKASRSHFDHNNGKNEK